MNVDKIVEKINNNNKFEILNFQDDCMVRLKCKKCGYIDTKSIYQAIDYRCGCINCYHIRKKQIAEDNLKQKLIDYHKNDKYELVEYNGKNQASIFKCKLCNNQFEALPSNVKRGKINCQNKTCQLYKNNVSHEKKYSIKDLAHKIMVDTNNEYKFVSSNIDIIKYDTKFKIQHVKCGHIYETSKRLFFYNKQNCPYCKKNSKYNLSYILAQQSLDNIEKGRYVLYKESYVNRRKKCIIYDNVLNIDFNLSFVYFIKKIQQDKTKHIVSHGENKIANYLNTHNIDHIRQKTFTNMLSNKNKSLFMDFYIPKYNTCIEYDGEYHYKNIFGKEVLRQQKENDKIKNNYCCQNNIKLIRISYKKFKNLDNIMDVIFSSLENNNKVSTINKKISKM